MLLKAAGSHRQVIHKPEEADYLTDNPNRRCPNLERLDVIGIQTVRGLEVRSQALTRVVYKICRFGRIG
jgi:hypothetical protein